MLILTMIVLYDLDIYANSDDVLYDLVIYANSDVLYDLIIYANSDDDCIV